MNLIDTTPGNVHEQQAKRRGFGFYASHLGTHSAEGPYMRRFIFRLPFNLGTIRLHNILRSDEDRHLHDHPFDFTSFLLTGCYTETTPCEECSDALSDCSVPHPNVCNECIDGKLKRHWPRFSIVRKRAEDLHCLKLDGPLWTLVFAGPKRRDWGFATEQGWVHNEEYAGRWPERVTRA